jgi:mycothiol synthase
MLAAFPVDHMPGHAEADIEGNVARLRIDPHGTAVALEDDRVVGYITPLRDDLTVHPDYRRRGHGRRLVAEGRRIVGERGLAHLQLHGPQHLAATRAFIDALGFRYHSSLWRFELSPDVEVPGPSFPPEVAVRALGAEEDPTAFVDLLNDSFLDHATPLSTTVEAVRYFHTLPGFDPSGILLVTPAAAPGELVGFARVEIQPARVGGRPVGCIRLIGVRREWRGRGLGRELLRWGIAHQRARGAGVVELSVEALNETATRIYRAAGFVPTIEWPHYVLDAVSSSEGGGGPSRCSAPR